MRTIILVKCKAKDLLKEIKKVADLSQLPDINQLPK